jgi:hypothetical protein
VQTVLWVTHGGGRALSFNLCSDHSGSERSPLELGDEFGVTGMSSVRAEADGGEVGADADGQHAGHDREGLHQLWLGRCLAQRRWRSSRGDGRGGGAEEGGGDDRRPAPG